MAARWYQAPSAARDRYLVPFAAAGFGSVTFAASLGLVLVNPANVGWLIEAGDPAIHFFGWHMFRASPWTTPAGALPHWTWPIGTSIGLTDSIPLLALPFKLLDPLLPRDFQYIGLWLLCCFALQGLFAALVMRTFTASRRLQVLGACLVVMSPPMIARHGHAALTAHWLVLAALWVYWRASPSAPFLPWAIVCTIAAATHPYLVLMVAAIMTAAHVRAVVQDHAAWRRCTSQWFALLACVAVMLWQCGYFVVSGGSLRGAGFGYHSMNLLAPVLPLEAYSATSGFFRPATTGQYEGYAYLGAGTWLLAPVAAAIALRHAWKKGLGIRSEHVPLLVVLVGLLVMSLGPAITIGPTTLLQYDSVWWGPLTIFRASGRMFWPVYYVVVFAILASVVRLAVRPALAILAVALLMQALDASSLYRSLRGVRLRGFTTPLQSHFWEAAAKQYQRLVLYPTSMCAVSGTFDVRPFTLLAGREGMAINAGASARPDMPRLQEYCWHLEQEMQLGIVDRNALYVLRRDLVPAFRAHAQVLTMCAVIDEHGVCVAEETISRWQDEFDVMFTVLPPLDEVVAFFSSLENDYRAVLRRPDRPVAGTLDERLLNLLRYIWYRSGGCAHGETVKRVLDPPAGPRLCGDPFRRRDRVADEDLLAFAAVLEAQFAARPSMPVRNSPVDLVGEAVWVHRYVAERLAGRDAYAARVEVQNAIASTAAR